MKEQLEQQSAEILRLRRALDTIATAPESIRSHVLIEIAKIAIARVPAPEVKE